MVLYDFYLILFGFHLILYGFHMIVYGFHMILYGFHMIYMVLYDFIWFLYDFWGCDLNFRMTRFSEFERSTGNSNVRPEIPTTTEFFGCPVFVTLSPLAGSEGAS